MLIIFDRILETEKNCNMFDKFIILYVLHVELWWYKIMC